MMKKLLEAMTKLAGESEQKTNDQVNDIVTKLDNDSKQSFLTQLVIESKAIEKKRIDNVVEESLSEQWANFNEDDLGVEDKRPHRAGTRADKVGARGHKEQPRYTTVKDEVEEAIAAKVSWEKSMRKHQILAARARESGDMDKAKEEDANANFYKEKARVHGTTYRPKEVNEVGIPSTSIKDIRNGKKQLQVNATFDDGTHLTDLFIIDKDVEANEYAQLQQFVKQRARELGKTGKILKIQYKPWPAMSTGTYSGKASVSRLAEAADSESLNIGDDVIITGAVAGQGKTGVVSDLGRDGRFVVVNLYNGGEHSFHASDVELNAYADSDEEEAYMYDRDPDARNGIDESLFEPSDSQAYKDKQQEKFDAELDSASTTTVYQCVGRGPDNKANFKFGPEFATQGEAVAYRNKLMANPKTPNPTDIGIRSISKVTENINKTKLTFTATNTNDKNAIINYVTAIRKDMGNAGVVYENKNSYRYICSAIFNRNKLIESNDSIALAGTQFMRRLDSLDQLAKLNLKVGDKIALINAIMTKESVELWGNTTPQLVTKIHMAGPDKIKQLEFNNDPNQVYPRTEKLTYNGQHIDHTAVFGNQKSAEHALTMLLTSAPADLTVKNYINVNSTLAEGIESADPTEGAVLNAIQELIQQGHTEVAPEVITNMVVAATSQPFLLKDLVAANNNSQAVQHYIDSINPNKVKFSTDILTVKNEDPMKDKKQAQAGVSSMAARAAGRNRLGEAAVKSKPATIQEKYAALQTKLREFKESRGHATVADKLGDIDNMRNVRIPTPDERREQIRLRKEKEAASKKVTNETQITRQGTGIVEPDLIGGFRKELEELQASDKTPAEKHAIYSYLIDKFTKQTNEYSQKVKTKVDEYGAYGATGTSDSSVPVSGKPNPAATQAIATIKSATGTTAPTQNIAKALGSASQGTAVNAADMTALAPMMQDVATIAQDPKLANQFKTLATQANKTQQQQK